MSMGKYIKKYRNREGLTQRELAARCGVATGTIQQYELDKRQPRVEQVQKIASALNVAPSALMGFDSNEFSSITTEEEYKQAVEMLEFFKGLKYEAQLDLRTIENFKILNSQGKERVVAYIEDLIKIPEYQDKEKIDLCSSIKSKESEDIDDSSPNNILAMKNYKEYTNNMTSKNWEELSSRLKTIKNQTDK